MKARTITITAVLVTVLSAGCKGRSTGGGDADTDADSVGDTTGDVELDTPADEVTDTVGDAPVDTVLDPPGTSALTAVWANSGEDKVVRSDLRARDAVPSVVNSVFDSERVNLFGARNEVVAFNLILEAADVTVTDVAVTLDGLHGPDGAVIGATEATGDGVFDWRGRNIELFHVGYLEIEGLSRLGYDSSYDERHVPERLRRPYTGEGYATGGWSDRPDADQEYPDIAVPMELVGTFDVQAGNNQSVWVDVTIPADAPAGAYDGNVLIEEQGVWTRVVPVRLVVRDFALPDRPTLGTMLYHSYGNICARYVGVSYPWEADDVADCDTARERHFMLAHRHRISLIGDEGSDAWTADSPRPYWNDVLDGSLFDPANGYDGPGAGVGNGIYSIGTYGSWDWQGEGEGGMRTHSDAWATWFATNAPDAEYFLYLIDESDDFAQIQQWATWVDDNPGPGSVLLTMATASVHDAIAEAPALDVPCTWAPTIGDVGEFEAAADHYATTAGKRLWLYNGYRPWTPSFMTDDDGVALRVLAWVQYKKRISRWFYWESTYYDNFQGGMGDTDVFATAQTFGSHDRLDDVLGETGWNYSNGDGVLFYPGTDMVFPASSYGVLGPFASLRLKHWRRGLQDGEYLALAAAVDPDAVADIVDARIPVVLWEHGVDDPSDPTWVRADVSWSTDPDDWEASRAALADIID